MHDSSDCDLKGTSKICNLSHARGACALQSLASCASIGIKMTKLCVQDFAVISNSRCKKDDITHRVIFDSGSQTILVRNKFAEQAGWSYSKAQYSLAGIGSFAKNIYGKLWNISLIDNEGNGHINKGYGVVLFYRRTGLFLPLMIWQHNFQTFPRIFS